MKLDIPEQIKAKLLADWNTVTGKDVSGKLNEHFKVNTQCRGTGLSLTSPIARHGTTSSDGPAAAQGI
jgi:hypothetical protein